MIDSATLQWSWNQSGLFSSFAWLSSQACQVFSNFRFISPNLFCNSCSFGALWVYRGVPVTKYEWILLLFSFAFFFHCSCYFWKLDAFWISIALTHFLQKLASCMKKQKLCLKYKWNELTVNARCFLYR